MIGLEIISVIHTGLKPYTTHLLRSVTDEDVEKLTEIKIKKVTKFDLNKAKEELLKLEAKIEDIKASLMAKLNRLCYLIF